jgi:hypothetical protein
MKPNLDTLKTEIEYHLEQAGLAVFHGLARSLDATSVIYWDCDEYPDYKLFVQSALAAGARLIVLHEHKFAPEQVEEALEQLETCELPHEEKRQIEHRLNRLPVHAGSVCAIELSFDLQGRVYLFDLRTEWYAELSDILDAIQLMISDPDDDDTPLGGYFSKN